MTKITPVKKKCSVCNNVKEFLELASTNTMGLPDLDTRPAPMARNTIAEWIERCPSCGYCASDIKLPLENKNIIKSDTYRRQLKNKDFPELTDSFLCWSIIQENIGNFAKAGWASIHGAWAADDNDNNKAAKYCRKKAVSLLKKATEEGQNFSDQKEEESLIMIDLLRRCGDFDEALKTCQEAIKDENDKMISDLLDFELELIKNKDQGCHKASEVIRE